MHIDWWTLGLQTVNVLVLIWLLKRFLLQPVTAIIEARQAAIAKQIDDTAAAKKSAEDERDALAREAEGLAAKRSEAFKAITAEADAAKAAMQATAEAEIAQMRLTARSDIAQARRSEASVYADHANGLAIDIAEKLLSRLPDDARVAGFIDGLAEAVAALPAESRNSLGDTASPIRIKSARALTQTEAAACRDRLAAVLGHPIEIEIVTEPGLIAGLEIDTSHVLVRNSFRADLERIGLELSRHDQHGT